MSKEQASEVVAKARPIFPQWDVYACLSHDGTFSVKVRDRDSELILKIEDPNTDLEVYRW